VKTCNRAYDPFSADAEEPIRQSIRPGQQVEWRGSRGVVKSSCGVVLSYKGDEVLTITTHGWVLPEKKMIAAQSFTEAVGNIANNAFGRDTSVLCSIYLFILSYGMEPMGYGLKMRKKARKEKQ
jgi:hypothetical protein